MTRELITWEIANLKICQVEKPSCIGIETISIETNVCLCRKTQKNNSHEKKFRILMMSLLKIFSYHNSSVFSHDIYNHWASTVWLPQQFDFLRVKLSCLTGEFVRNFNTIFSKLSFSRFGHPIFAFLKMESLKYELFIPILSGSFCYAGHDDL